MKKWTRISVKWTRISVKGVPMPDGFARLLRRLLVNGSVPRSQISARSIEALRSLFETGALLQVGSASGIVIQVVNREVLELFHKRRYPAIGADIEAPPRATAAVTLRNAKRVSRSDQELVLLRAFRPLVCARENRQSDLSVATRQTGAACLLLEAGRFFELNACVAIVENLENFINFEKMGVDADVALYASGRCSNLVLKWLGSSELSRCRFIHCGDYDPVGLDEYLRLKHTVGNRASLYVPETLRQLVVKYGRAELLRNSEAVLKRVRQANDAAVRSVARILDETGLGLEQEVLLVDSGGC